ncbi:MAG: energy-coupling factor transporter ATPase [Treponema sp.]|nr:energy-coupling factor transporter ATPase [Treponema sp.]MCL2250660.1 energy-coupling factor transporter ATPase [Treponema sp.]
MSFICFENVFFTYPKKQEYALEGINLSVTEGEFLAVMGENGAGKTTFCKLINGIIPHLTGGKLSGTVTVDTLNTKDASVAELSLKAGIVLDDPESQLFTSTVRQEAAFGPENLCLPKDEIEQRAEFALNAVGLAQTGFENRKISTLSGGEKQRLSVAAALAMKGKILILDEPLCRLDPQGAREVLNILKEINEKFHITVIIASGNTALMAEYADKVCILKNAKIAAYDTSKNIFSNNALLEENGIEPVSNIDNPCSLFSFPSSLTNYSASSVIDINNFSYTYSNNISIENINLSIKENDITAIIGENGCGKTTLLKNITGLLRPSLGDIILRNKNIKELSVSEISNDIGFVMQNPGSQLFTDSVFNEVAFALKNMRLSKEEIKHRTEQALIIADIKDKFAFPHSLCRADQTKTVIACVIAMGVKIIILDEIDVGNDYKGNLKIMKTLKELQEKAYTIIFVTHNMNLASFADRLIKMDRKGIVFDGRRN